MSNRLDDGALFGVVRSRQEIFEKIKAFEDLLWALRDGKDGVTFYTIDQCIAILDALNWTISKPLFGEGSK